MLAVHLRHDVRECDVVELPAALRPRVDTLWCDRANYQQLTSTAIGKLFPWPDFPRLIPRRQADFHPPFSHTDGDLVVFAAHVKACTDIACFAFTSDNDKGAPACRDLNEYLALFEDQSALEQRMIDPEASFTIEFDPAAIGKDHLRAFTCLRQLFTAFSKPIMES